jgi:hypothetical protein
MPIFASNEPKSRSTLKLCALLLSVWSTTTSAISYTSLTGKVTVDVGVALLPVGDTLSSLGVGQHDGIGQINAAMISSVFAPDHSTIVRRNGFVTGPTDYETLPASSPSQANPLTLTTQGHNQNFEVNDLSIPFPQFGFAVNGLIDGNPEGILSMLFDYEQVVLGFNILGIDPQDPVTNPDTSLFVDFFDRNGAILDRIDVSLAGQPQYLSLYFTVTDPSMLFAGVSISTNDTFGLGYSTIRYATSPEPSSGILVATCLIACGILRRARVGIAAR